MFQKICQGLCIVLAIAALSVAGFSIISGDSIVFDHHCQDEVQLPVSAAPQVIVGQSPTTAATVRRDWGDPVFNKMASLFPAEVESSIKRIAWVSKGHIERCNNKPNTIGHCHEDGTICILKEYRDKSYRGNIFLHEVGHAYYFKLVRAGYDGLNLYRSVSGCSLTDYGKAKDDRIDSINEHEKFAEWFREFYLNIIDEPSAFDDLPKRAEELYGVYNLQDYIKIFVFMRRSGAFDQTDCIKFLMTDPFRIGSMKPIPPRQ